jgi:hypothetical protein
LAIAIKILFFAHGSPVADTPQAPPAEDKDPVEEAMRMLLRY